MSSRNWKDRIAGGRRGEGPAPAADDASAPYAPPEKRGGLSDNPLMLGAMVVVAVAVVVFLVVLAIR